MYLMENKKCIGRNNFKEQRWGYPKSMGNNENN